MAEVDRDVKWFAKADFSKYEHKYVAIVDQQIVSSGEDPEEVYNKAAEKYPGQEIILWKVTGTETLILIYGSRF